MNTIVSGLTRLTYHSLPLLVEPEEKISIVIPMRNEAHHIDNLINDLAKLYYPSHLLEIILVDDHSRTQQLEYIKKKIRGSSLNNCKLLFSPSEGKKSALYYGIVEASNTIVLQTDADCRIPSMWVNAMVESLLANKAKAVIGAVKMEAGKGFWSKFAALDFMSLQTSGIGLVLKKKAIMANGANLGFFRKIWLDHRKTGENLSSGDDVFFIQSLSKEDKRSVAFCAFEGSIISTDAPENLKDFIQQRVRWGGKSPSYVSGFGKIIALTVGLYSILIISLLVLGFWDVRLHDALFVAFIAKFVVDAWVLKSFARETGQLRLLKLYPFAAIIYPFYISWVVGEIFFPFSGSKWKGRVVKT